MNEFGEPNMGNPSVRFDEGREGAGHWRQRLSTQPLLPTLLTRMEDGKAEIGGLRAFARRRRDKSSST
jgi:hypothetical protein